ncbi:MAG: FkbM family methyltransferase [Planctomycetes bacterium]|nr:FkbM family methyltransferase [Planctomycetota bacterium]
MLAQKLRRLLELFRLTRAAADRPSRKLIRGCYLDLGACLGDRAEIELAMKGAAGPVRCRLRRCDVFTLAEIFAEGVYRPALPLPARPFIVDAGANIGLASLWFKARCPEARIAAFEPDADNADLARRNLAGHAGCAVHEIALDRVTGRASLHRGDHDAVHSLVDDSAQAGSVEVETRTLADFMASSGESRIDVLKLDVEGAELRVLEGMGDWLDRTTLVIGELHEAFVSAAELRAALAAHGLGLELFDLEEQGVRGFVARRS